MGKGDIKTRKGKRRIGSYGKHRPHKDRNVSALKVNDKKEERDADSDGVKNS